MKRCLVLLLLLVIAVGLVRAENMNAERFRINGLLPTEMSVEELYDLEDSLVSSLVICFYEDAEEVASGERLGIYVINPKTKKFHYPWCYSALEIGSDRKFSRTIPSRLVEQGYKPCGRCNPHINQLPSGND